MASEVYDEIRTQQPEFDLYEHSSKLQNLVAQLAGLGVTDNLPTIESAALHIEEQAQELRNLAGAA